MLTKYRLKIRYPEVKIEEVEIARETESCVFIPTSPTKRNLRGEHKESKMSDWVEYHDTWEAAYAVLTDRAARQVANARRGLEIANSFAENVKGIRRLNVEVSGAQACHG